MKPIIDSQRLISDEFLKFQNLIDMFDSNSDNDTIRDHVIYINGFYNALLLTYGYKDKNVTRCRIIHTELRNLFDHKKLVAKN